MPPKGLPGGLKGKGTPTPGREDVQPHCTPWNEEVLQVLGGSASSFFFSQRLEPPGSFRNGIPTKKKPDRTLNPYPSPQPHPFTPHAGQEAGAFGQGSPSRQDSHPSPVFLPVRVMERSIEISPLIISTACGVLFA